MFFLERYMKKLKGFVLHRENLDGSIVEGYMVNESLYYASEYIKKIDHTPGSVIWDDEHDEEKREGKLLEMKGKRRLIRSKSLIFRSPHFHIVTIHNKIQNLYLFPYILNVLLFP